MDKLNQYFCNTAKRVQEEAFTDNTETPNMDFQSNLTKLPKLIELFSSKESYPMT